MIFVHKNGEQNTAVAIAIEKEIDYFNYACCTRYFSRNMHPFFVLFEPSVHSFCYHGKCFLPTFCHLVAQSIEKKFYVLHPMTEN